MGLGQSKTENAIEDVQGLQVVRVLPQSPAHVSGLLPFFDIITAVDQTRFEKTSTVSNEFRSYVAGHERQQLCLEVYNMRMRSYRNVLCVPSRDWGGGGLLGCSVEWARADRCAEQCFHIVDVLPQSPVDRCREIKAERDYIIGMQRAEEPIITLINDENDFHDRVEMWRTVQREDVHRRSNGLPPNALLPGKLLFLVYNSEANEIKEIAVDLTGDVEAPLGVNVATGLLHLVPPVPEGVVLPVFSFLPTDNAASLVSKPIEEKDNATGGPHEALQEPPLQRALPPNENFSLQTHTQDIHAETCSSSQRESVSVGVSCNGADTALPKQLQKNCANDSPPRSFPKLPPPIRFPTIRPKTPTK